VLRKVLRHVEQLMDLLARDLTSTGQQQQHLHALHRCLTRPGQHHRDIDRQMSEKERAPRISVLSVWSQGIELIIALHHPRDLLVEADGETEDVTRLGGL